MEVLPADEAAVAVEVDPDVPLPAAARASYLRLRRGWSSVKGGPVLESDREDSVNFEAQSELGPDA